MTTSSSLIRTLVQSTSRFALLIVASALVSIIFSLWGWYALRETLDLNIGDVLYRSLGAPTLAFPYHSSVNWLGDWRLEVARWCGMFALVAGVTKTVFHVFGDHLVKKQASRRRNHWIIIGNEPLTKRLCDAATAQGHHVNWLNGAIDENHARSKHLYIDTSQWSLPAAMELGLQRARGVVVDTDSDATAHAIAREIRSAVPNENQLTVMTSIRSPWLGMRVDEIEGASGVRIFSEAQMAVRRLHRIHPPFLIADKLGHSRLHIVIVDFSEYGEAVLIETLLSSLTITLGKPVATIIDPDAMSVCHGLQLRYPELAESVDLHFVNGQLSNNESMMDVDTFNELATTIPITAVYCCPTSDDDSLTSALAMQAISVKSYGGSAPVFVRQNSARSIPPAKMGASQLKPAQLIGFGALDELAQDTGLFANSADDLAKAFHEAYQAIATDDKPAKTLWDNLSEDMRDSNRRLVVHIPAKLHCIGLDLERWLHDVGSNFETKQLPLIDVPPEQSELIEQLAELEHERWMADRRINGWTYGKERDDVRRTHTDLIAYSELSDASKEYDRQMVASLIKMVSQ